MLLLGEEREISPDRERIIIHMVFYYRFDIHKSHEILFGSHEMQFFISHEKLHIYIS
jgi:hypothetical protein